MPPIHSTKDLLRKLRGLVTFWLPEQTPEHLHQLRSFELSVIIGMLPPGGRILEVGAGTGWQALQLNRAGYEVIAVDLPSSNYRSQRMGTVIDYDGSRLPFKAGSFDIVFSSNVLEHIPAVKAFQEELLRVLKPGGMSIHVLPSSSWRIWTNLTHVLRYCTFPNRHGAIAGNAISEIYYFSRSWWQRLFHATGWSVTHLGTTRLFYTGNSIFDSRMGLPLRAKLGRFLGSACNVFVLKRS